MARIERLDLFKVPPRWLFLKVTTDEGVEGWGEPVVEGRADTVAAAVREMGEYLVGSDPTKIEDLWQALYRGGFYRGGPILMSAISGIEQALWDISGKMAGLPVHRMMGGAVRDKMRVYSWIGGDRPDDVVTEAKKRVDAGMTAVKMNGTEEMAWIDSFTRIEEVISRVQALRDAFGHSLDIAVDFHGRVHLPMARVLMKELEPFRLMFIEEPVLVEHREAFRELRRHTVTPIATGERSFSRWDFKDLITGGGVDILQP
ncbi:MAG TPA: galactonate dehydratase, partial [Aminivibrio sp.]|nr:galactonate dehydratase [Aminivibrio sp.]